jgi:hypothetical protein
MTLSGGLIGNEALGAVVFTAPATFGSGGAVTEDFGAGNDIGYAITTDGNFLYVTGERTAGGTVGGNALYTVAYDVVTGNIVWATTTDLTSANDLALAIATDGERVYVTGACNTGCLGAGSVAAYTMALDPKTGARLWATTSNQSAGQDIAYGIESDGTRVFVTTYCSGCGSLGSGSYHTIAYQAATGAQLWATTTDPSAGDDVVTSLTTDGNRVYVTGSCATCGTGGSMYTVAYDSVTGVTLWVTSTNPSAGDDTATDIAVANGLVYIVGFCQSCGPGSTYDVYLAALNPATGAVVWTTTSDDTYSNPIGSNLVVDADTVYVSGYCNGCGAVGSYAILTFAFDAHTGTPGWSTTHDPTSGVDIPRGITKTADTLYTTGYCSSCGVPGGTAYYTFAQSAVDGSLMDGTQNATFANNASTSAMTITSSSSVTATNPLTTSTFINNGSFVAPTTHTLLGSYTNTGSVDYSDSLVTMSSNIRDYFAGVSTTPTASIRASAIVGTTLYLGQDEYAGTCNTATGVGCELLVYDISSTTNPVFAAAREAGVNGEGSYIWTMTTVGSTLYIGVWDQYNGTCNTATGQSCELLIYNIASTTNPILVGGREAGIGSAGEDVLELAALGTTLYVGRGAYVGTCNTATGQYCELLIYNIASTTNPILVGGRETGSGSEGSFVTALTTFGTTLYVGRAAYTGTCNIATGQYCELLVYNVASTTNPVFTAGREAGTGSGGGDLQALTTFGTTLYAGRSAYTGTCNTSTGEFCELLVYSLASTTSPVFAAGREAGVGANGALVRTLSTIGSTLYLGRAAYTGACVTSTGVGCELLVYNVASTTNPVFTTGRESGSGSSGSEIITFASTPDDTSMYVGRFSAGITCVPTTGENCELLLYTFAPSLSGTMTGTNAFNDFSVAAGAVRFTDSASTTGTMSMAPGTTATFNASSTYTFQDIDWEGTAGMPIILQSSASGTPWYLDVPGSQVSVSYLDVSDSNATLTEGGILASTSTDSGRNTNWCFGACFEQSNMTLTNHTAGTISNTFSFANKTDEELFTFRLEPEESTDVTELTLSVLGINDLDIGDLTDWRLYVDTDNDKDLDGGDTQVGGAGSFDFSGNSGSVTFTTPFTVATATNFIVTADLTSINNNASVGLWVLPAGITAVTTQGAGAVQVSGATTRVSHNRSNRGAGGSSARFGGDAPPGAGIVSGGGPGGDSGNNPIGQVPDGDNIAPDPNFFRPTGHSGSWNNGGNALLSDGVRAQAPSITTHTFSGFGFAIPSSNTITGIEVKLDSRYTSQAGTISVDISWNNGSNYSSTRTTPTLLATDAVYTVGSITDMWDRTWSPSEFNDGSLLVRVTANVSLLELDGIEFRVYHQATGGGAGGGGAF